MALVDPKIAMSFRTPETPNMLGQYAQIAQIQSGQQAQQLNALKMQELQQGIQETNAMRGLDLKDPDYRAKVYGISPARGQAFDVAQTEAASKKATTGKMEVETAAAKQKLMSQGLRDISSRPDNEQITTYLRDVQESPLFSPAEKLKAQQNAAMLLGMPFEERKAYLASQGASAAELKPVTSVGPTGIVQTPAFGGAATVVSGTDAAFQMTPAQIAQNKIAQGQLGVSQGQLSATQQRLAFDKEKATQPVFNAQAGGFIAPPTKENPGGKFIPATGIQAAKDQSAAVRALQSAGYNVETGEDTISKLIEKSTSGGLQAGSAAALAFFGKSTEGRKAIAALEGTANQIATDLAGGKLGAGISNTDREFIVGALGDVANPMKTAEERLSGWTAAKNRMMLTGLIPPPKTAGAAAGVDTSNPLLQVSP